MANSITGVKLLYERVKVPPTFLYPLLPNLPKSALWNWIWTARCSHASAASRGNTRASATQPEVTTEF